MSPTFQSPVPAPPLPPKRQSTGMLADEAETIPVTYGVLDFIEKTPFRQTKPYTIAGPLPAAYEGQRTNLVTSPRSIALRDVRGHEGLVDINEHGVEIVKLVPRTPLDTICDESAQEYLVHLAGWVQQRLGAAHCFCYAYKFRSSLLEPDRPLGSYSGTRGVPDEPAPLPHIDHTHQGGPNRIRRHLSADEQARYLGHEANYRLRILTMWRPINGTVEDYPLAFCDPFSVDAAADLVAGDRITSQHVGEVYYIAHNARQRWFWLSDQTTDEVILFNSYDSARGIGPAFTPHGTFRLGDVSQQNRPRESLEARFIIIG